MRYCHKVFVRQPDGEIREISPGTGVFNTPCVRPDGRDAVCQGTTGGPPGLWRLPVGGGQVEQITPTGMAAFMPAYSWDGRMIVFSADGGAGTGPQTMDAFFTWPPPESTSLNLFTVNVDSGDIRRITHGHCHDWRPSFSPDGLRIVFVSNRGGPMQLWSVDADGRGEPCRLQNTHWGMRPWYARDGRTIFFHTEMGGRHRICRMAAEGGPVEPLPNDDRGMSHGVFALPDEDCLLMHSSRDGGSGLWRLPLDGAEPARIQTPGFTVAGHPTQARTGHLVFDSTQDGPEV